MIKIWSIIPTSLIPGFCLQLFLLKRVNVSRYDAMVYVRPAPIMLEKKSKFYLLYNFFLSRISQKFCPLPIILIKFF